VAEQALASFIKTENETREADNAVAEAKGEDTEALITGGALVAIDVNTGEPLVIASYPTYSLDTYWDDYADLVSDTVYSPLLNRALQGEYAPGSTFKPVTALAALCENFIGAESTFVCTGVYEKYASLGYSPRCTGTHGTLTVTDAITASCNLFFYQVGDLIGIEAIDEYATTLGLGQSTGIELYEEDGRVASPETKAQAYANSAVDQEWYAADTLQAAIGQSITGVTPIQLARYCAALANSGTVYNCSLVKSISSYDYSESIFERTPSVFNTLDAGDYVWDLIHTGMWGVANTPYGTAYSILGGYEPQVAAKTGTTETGAQTEDAVFICYAPADDPEIAIAVVVEKGKRGAKLADIAKTVLDYYFDFEMSTQQVESELTLLH
jgi:penicillin-binding protein 2